MSSPKPPQHWKQMGSMGSLDGLARSTISLDVPEARNCREVREQGRKEMHVLNEKLASQLEKMRLVSEQNRKLTDESNGSRDLLQERVEKLRQTYNAELRQLRQLVDDCEREKADSLAKMATLQQNVRSKEDQIQHLSQINQKLSHQLDQALKDVSLKDADNALLQRHVNAAEEETARIRHALEQSKQNNQQLHTNLDDETASRMACQAEMQTLREEMEFQRTVHEQELEELRAVAHADHEQDRDQWRDEMQRAIRDIQTEYDQRLDKIRNEMDANYANRLSEASKNNANHSSQMQQIMEENNTLKQNLDAMRRRAEQYRAKSDQLESAYNDSQEESQNLRRKLDGSLREANRERQVAEDALNRALSELSSLTDAKLNLESEIAAYRRLLEAQDTLFSKPMDIRKSRDVSPIGSGRPKELSVRVPSYSTVSHMSGINQNSRTDAVNRWIDRDEPSGQSARPHHMERTVEGSQQLSCSFSDSEKLTTNQNENYYRGSLALAECSRNGSYIELNNTGKVEVKLAGWCLIRNIDHGRRITRYTLPNRSVPALTAFRIWASGKMPPNAGLCDFEAPYSNWGTGNLVQTSLYSPDGAEKATHTQRVDYSP